MTITIEVDAVTANRLLPKISVQLDGKEVQGVTRLSEHGGWVEQIERDARGRLVRDGDKLKIRRTSGSVKIWGATAEQRRRFAQLHPELTRGQ